MTREEAIRIIEKEIHIDVRCCTHEDACRFEDALRMAISALREQEDPKAILVQQYIKVPEKPQWISVEERLPAVHQRVLVYCQSKTIERHITACMYMGGYFSRKVRNVTHWMPLPEPPEVEG